jgi:hypothetical protein
MSLNVANCPTCGIVYQKNFRDMCTSCSSQLDDALNLCTKYLWRHPKSTTEELSLAVNVDVSQIIKFIKQGVISNSFSNLTYPCESCTSPIANNRLCMKCNGSFRELAQQLTNPKSLVPTNGFKIRDRLNF